MAKKTKKSSGASAGRKKKKKGGSRIRRVLVVLVLLAAAAGIGWFFRDAFGAFGDRVKDRLSETKQKLPTVTITAAPAAPETGSPAAAPAVSTPAPVREQLIGRIVEVMDGDTLTVSSGDNTFKVRLYGVDAPEVLQDYGIVSRDMLRDKVLDGEAEFNVVSVRDGLYYSRVSYDGRDINYEMVRDGHAWYDKQNAPGETALEKAQNEAQRAKQGLWSVKSPTPPWVFRSRNR